MALRIILLVLTAFIIAFSILTLSLFSYQYKFQDGNWKFRGDDIYRLEKNFYSQHVNTDEKKIFLLGSSQIMELNTTYIEEYLSTIGQDYKVYNLAIAGDNPKERLRTLDMIISDKPKIVVYGISDRDFQTINPVSTTRFTKPTSILPDIHDIFDELFFSLEMHSKYDLDFMKSPKLENLKSIRESTRNPVSYERFVPYPMPFFNITKPQEFITSNLDLKKTNQWINSYNPTSPPDRNKNVIALNEIIDKLHENDIKVIVFTTPQQKYRLDDMPNYVKESFNSVLKYISNKSNMTIYSLYNRYADLNIWYDYEHIAVNKNSTIYSEDAAKIILKEIQK